MNLTSLSGKKHACHDYPDPPELVPHTATPSLGCIGVARIPQRAHARLDHGHVKDGRTKLALGIAMLCSPFRTNVSRAVIKALATCVW